MNLPDGIRANFAAQSIAHADGRPLQRVGFQPDVYVEPTLGAIRAGRDELLEKSIEILNRM